MIEFCGCRQKVVPAAVHAVLGCLGRGGVETTEKAEMDCEGITVLSKP